jgi:hypothetical protein
LANPPFGKRLANDVLLEISYHLVCPVVNTTLASAVTVLGSQTVLLTSADWIYIGAMLVVDTGANAEIITVTAIAAPSITAVFANTHAIGAPVVAATFPLQQTTDPVFTQSEMLGYLSRAQNEFLQAVPCVFQIFRQIALIGQVVQVTPSTSIELNRVAASRIANPISTLVRSGNVVTATFANPHGQVINNTFWVINPVDPTFQGVFQVLSVPTSRTLTYSQIAANASTTGGIIAFYVRMYETTQEELNMVNRQWQQTPGQPTSWFEDRTGLYHWGLAPKPEVQVPVELLASIRDTDTLGLLDGFLVPDNLIFLVKWQAIGYALEKDGVWQDMQRAAYCHERYKRGVMAVSRFMDAMMGMGG